MKSKSALGHHKRAKTIISGTTTVSRYARIPTENLKFQQFIDALFASKMTRSDVRDEVKAYVGVLETNYTDTIRDLKTQVESLLKKLQKVKSEKAN